MVLPGLERLAGVPHWIGHKIGRLSPVLACDAQPHALAVRFRPHSWNAVLRS